MKYGLLYYKDTDNIGDDIQAYAAERFLPRVDYMIDRENIEMFSPEKKEYVSVIMNAWYVHDKFNFNFSPYINPLFISMFFKDFQYVDGVTVGTDYLNNSVRKTLKKHSPVGTRDLHTKKVMDKLSIPNYFSGCLTLTLRKFENVEKQDYIIAVGLSDKEFEYIKKRTNRNIIRIIQDIPMGSLSDMSWEDRKKQVENVLKTYQGAHMVVTTKLHCSLPCLALETPVLLLYDSSSKENKDRIGTYKDYLNYINREEFLNTEIDFDNPKPNKTKHLQLRNQIINTCEEFIKNSKSVKLNDKLIEPSIYNDFVEEQRDMRNVILKHHMDLTKKYVNECKKCSKYYDKMNEYINDNNRLKKEINNIYNSKSWKLICKIRKAKSDIKKIFNKK